MEHIDNFKKSLDEWAKSVRLTTHQELAKATFLAMLKTNPIVSSFSIWLLVISGAAATLIISNIADITTIVSETSIKSALFILIMSAIAGILVKGVSLYIDVFIQMNKNINEPFEKILRNHDSQEEGIKEVAGTLTDPPDTQIDFNVLLKEFSEPFPAWYRKKIYKAAEETAKDALWIHKRYVKLLFGMGLAVGSQVVLFLLFVFVIAVSI
jgi:hypothetical protein